MASVQEMAQELQTTLIQHDKAASQLHHIDRRLAGLDGKIFAAELEGNDQLKLRRLTHKSVIDGVRQVYVQYVQEKQQQIHKMSTSIIHTLQPDDVTDYTLQLPRRQGPSIDAMVTSAAEVFSVYYRNM